MKRYLFLFIIVICCAFTLVAQTPSPAPATAPAPDLLLGKSDLRIETSNDGGYLIFVRKKPDIQSIMLTESTEPDDHKVASFALRSKEFQPLNANEKRKLDGNFLESKGMYYLLSSTVIEDKEFGKAFRIFLPYIVIYGYPWSRYGERSLFDNSYLSIRAFTLPYADYDGPYKDNPYTLRITQNREESVPAGYNKETIRAYSDYAALSANKLRYSKGEADLLKTITDILTGQKGALDLVICLDATMSMQPHAPFIREKLTSMLKEFAASHPGSRFALIQYRDYMEEFLYKMTPFGTDYTIIQNALDQFRPWGGHDVPEAINEALYAALTELDWKTDKRLIILAGDAPPHPIPRGTISGDMVSKEAKNRNVSIEAIILPN